MTIPFTWVRAVRGHGPTPDGMTLRYRKTGGQLLASAPRAVRSSRAGEQFAALLEHLDGHEKECRATVGSWMLNGLPVLAGLLAGAWPGPWWRAELLEEVSEDGWVSVRTADGVP